MGMEFGADLFMGRENGKAGAGRLVLVWGPQGPEGNGAASELREPTLKLRLCGIVRKASHVEHLAALGQEGSHISTRIHWPREDIGMFRDRLGLADQASQNPCEGDGLLHRAARGGGCQSLQVER